ncbi:MAG: hypothetical protein ABL927_01065 [Bdellovibrionales bacterium]
MKNFIKYVVIFFTVALAFVTIKLQAQDFQKDPLTLEGQGNLLTVRMVFGSKKAKIFLTGKEAAKIDFSKNAKLLKITAFKEDGSKEELQFIPGKGYYTVQKLPEWTGPYMFQVETKFKNKTESIDIRKK